MAYSLGMTKKEDQDLAAALNPGDVFPADRIANPPDFFQALRARGLKTQDPTARLLRIESVTTT